LQPEGKVMLGTPFRTLKSPVFNDRFYALYVSKISYKSQI